MPIARGFIETARALVPDARGRPRQTDLRRAASTIYYAAFHRLAQCCADRLVGTGPAQQTWEWTRVYRSLDHARCAKVCSSSEARRLSPKVRRLTSLMPDLMGRRHAADYDPGVSFTKQGVQRDIEVIEAAMDSFDSTPREDQRALAVLLLFRKRTN